MKKQLLILMILLSIAKYSNSQTNFAIGPSFSYGSANGTDFKNTSRTIFGAEVYKEINKHFSFITGLLYSRRYYYSIFIPPAFNPSTGTIQNPNNLVAYGYPWYCQKDVNIVNKSLLVPLDFSYKFLNRSSFDLYGRAGISLDFKLSEFSYGKQYMILNDSTITDGPDYYQAGRYRYYFLNSNINENKFKLQEINIEFAIGGEIVLSDHIKSGIEIKEINNSMYNSNEDDNALSIGINAKYYFGKIDRHKVNDITK